jgi:RimJ/RimL family protein N-acetyltransferase
MTFEPQEIHTERLLLRHWRTDDVDDAFAYASEPEWARYLWFVPSPYTYGDAEEFIARVTTISWDSEADFAIELDSHVIGGIRLYLGTPSSEARIAGMGYNVGRSYWNHGYVTEAATAMLRYAFEASGLHKVYATADGRNIGSIRVMQKVGMQEEARLRQHRFYRGEYADQVQYGILASEWRAAQR